MKIRFNRDSEIEVVEYYDEKKDEVVTSNITFKKGEETEWDVLDDKGERMDVQFGDGSCCYGLDKGCFEVISVCPCCGKTGEQGEGCPTCPGFWFTNDEETYKLLDCIEQERQDQESGLYPEKWDDAN